MFCRNCGTDVTDMKYCPKCGTPTTIENENVAKGEKLKGSKVKRKYVLAIFGIGIALLVIAVTALLSKSSSKTIDNTAIPTMSMTEESPQVTEETTDEEDITHNWWKDKAFQSTDSGLYFWIEEISDVWTEEELEKLIADGLANGNELWFMVGPEYLNDQNCLVVGAVDKSEISVGIEEEYGYIYYSFHDNTSLTQVLILYDPNNDMVFVTSKSDLNDKWLNESDTYYAVDPAEQLDEIYDEQQPEEVYEESTEVLVSAENGILTEGSYISDNADDSADDRVNMLNYFFDGQRFECFETNSGEDMILTIYLFYNSDGNGNMISDIPSMYKGTLSNGTEFWFEPYESSQDSERYVINCDDGSAAYLEYRMDMSEINFLVENGMLYNYGGTYISLPDSED